MSDQPNQYPTTLKDTIQYLLSRLDDKNRAALKAIPKNDLVLLHHSYGAGIRNELGLHGRNQALLKDPEIAAFLGNSEKIINDPLLASRFADHISGLIIIKLWEHLQDAAE